MQFGRGIRWAGATCVVLSAWLLLSGSSTEAFRWQLPAWVPPPVTPADNAMSAAKVELGRRLFYDNRLSGNGAFACSSCHRQEPFPSRSVPT